MSIDEILKLENDELIIQYLKQRKTPLPDVVELLDEWIPERHDVMNPTKRKDGKTMVKEGYIDSNGLEHEPIYKDEPVNRIALPIEQDITNIQTAFCVGKEPTLDCKPNNDGEKDLLSIIKKVNNKNKMRYHNKRFVRSWFSEKEVAEYWYVVKDESFWSKVYASLRRAVGMKVKPKFRLKCALWSPLRGDKLYPHFNEAGDYDALGREYTITDEKNVTHTYFMCVTSQEVITWDITKGIQRVSEKSFKHNFEKNPTIYMYRPFTLCHHIKPSRARLEELLSNFADCIDAHFFPKLIMEGDIENKVPQDIGKSKLIKIENGGKVYYLNWEQTSEGVRLELESHLNECYNLTQTPRLTLETLKGLGDVPSGRAFDFLFMGTRFAVEDHYEVIGEAMQRRYNFLVSAIGSINPSFREASETIDIDVKMNQYTLDFLAEKIKNALDACGDTVVSQKTGILMAGIVDDVDDEFRQILEERKEKEPIEDPNNQA